MSIWLFRAGRNGEFENKFLKDKRIYLTWDNLQEDLSKYSDRASLLERLSELYSNENPNTIRNWASQIYPIAHRIEKGDWVVLPSKLSSTIHFGRVIGDYVFDKNAESPYFHYRDVEWFATDIPRSKFDQDLLYSFGAFMTVCKITRNDAEKRLKEMANNDWKTKAISFDAFNEAVDVVASSLTDIEMAAIDAISNHIIQKFQGYRMEELISEILKAKGFTVFHSKQGADGGKDLLASGGEMGFGSPKICVQVKSHDTPVDRPTLDQLGGVMSKVGAEYGLLVSWSGFKNSVEQERGNQFFRIRLWDSTDVIKEIFNNYGKLSPEIQADIPLKRIWMLSDDGE
ncbi:restriction endonuclease [Butyrivibrio sp. XB500-5]|uniref:restriction endonuclease n=1 Tax=Butyrivibrio sp. XB500-5 TaxID=2364880 RepID=UPI000EA8E2CA|nr:restriction endonuclease [Butyrivibrio sp. XB500-5]RKM56739.1 restriction endonuclease [Butyrivibrio sp. XB500-5]